MEERKEINHEEEMVVSESNVVENEISENGNVSADYQSFGLEELISAIENLMKGSQLLQFKNDISEIDKAATELLKQDTDESASEEDDNGQVIKLKKLLKDLNKRFYTERKQRVEEEKENFKVKSDLLEKLKSLAENIDNPGEAFTKLQAIQEKWRQTGRVPASEASTLINNYRLYNDMFFDALSINRELRELDMKKNLELKVEVCEKMEKLAAHKNILQAVRELGDVVEEWKNIGRIPDADFESLNERFKKALDTVHERRAKHNEEEDLKREKNLEAKKTLCKEAKELLETNPENHAQWKALTDKFDEIFNRWRKIGFTPKHDKGKVWNEFKALRRELNQRKDSFYKNLREEFKENAQVKAQIIEKAKALLSHENHVQAIRDYKRLVQDWKNSPSSSRKEEQKFWKEFKSLGDQIFGKLQEEKDKEKAMWKQRAEARKALAEKLNSLTLKKTFEESVADLQAVHDEWNLAGVVDAKEKNAIYELFFKAYQGFIAKLEKQFADESYSVAISRLKVKSETITEKGRKELGNKKQSIIKRINELTNEITQVENNMGFFKNAKSDSPLLKEYADKIQKGKEEIQKLKKELDIL
jgi:DNA repair exonuclease SbcCD ATPase subunit